MGQSKLELAVGTGQWDAGLRKAQQSLNAFTQAQGGLQQALNKDNGDMQKFIQMMSKMDSTANTAKGQMNDYKRVLEQLTADYNRMSDAQKNSIGQDYLQTIDALKQKFQAAKQQVEDFNNSLNDLGDVKLPEIKGGGSMFGGLTDMLSVAGGNLLASGIQKLGSEIMDTVQQGVELARAGEGVRLAFERLNRPGLLDNLKEATHGTVSELELMKAAVKFDDFNLPVEQLGTLLAFAQKKAKDTGQSVDYMVDSIVTGLGRKSLMILDNLGLSAAQIKDRMKESGDMTVAVANIIKEQMAEAGEYVETAADRAARAAADAANEMEKLGMKAGPVAEEWGRTWNEIKFAGIDLLNTVLTPIADSLRDIREILSGEYTLKIKTEFDNPLGPNVDDNGNYIKKPGSGNWAGFNANNGTWNSGYYGAIYNSSTGQMEFPDFVVNGTNRQKTKKKTKTGGGNKTIKTEEQLNTEEISKLTQEYIHASEQRRAAIRDEIKVLQERNELIQALKDQAQGKGFDPTKMQQITDLSGRTPWATPDQLIKEADVKLPLKLEVIDTTPLTQLENELKRLQEEQNILGRKSPELWQQYQRQIDATKGKISSFKGEGKKEDNDFDKGLGDMSKVVSGLSSVASGLQQMGIKLPEGVQKTLGVIQGLMSVIQGVNTIISVFSTSAEAANTVAVTGNTVAMTALTAAVAANTAAMSVNTATNFIPFFAHGGLVHAATGYMVPGNDHADRTLIAASSGELILNRAQQGVIAGELEGGAGRSVHVTGMIRGEDIVLVADHWGRRTGKGELAFWK